MKVEHPKTDRMLSMSGKEFVWDTDGCTDIHRFILKPIVDQLNQAQAEKVLDLGCGNGAFTALLGKNGFAMTGLDHSATGVEIASRAHPGTTFRQQDLIKPIPNELQGQFDAVIAIEVIEHLLLPRKLIENALLALKPEGLLIVSVPYHGYVKNLALALTNKFDDHWHPLRDFGHIKFFSKKTLTGLFMEYGLMGLHFETVGRISPFARSMLLSGKKPSETVIQTRSAIQ